MGQPGEHITGGWTLQSAYLAPFQQGLRLIPGIALLFAIGSLGKLAAAHVPHMEYVLFAIAFGALVSNTIPIPRVFAPGIRTYEFWLKVGIVLMGAKFAMSNVVDIGAAGITLVIAEICLAIVVARLLAKAAGLSEELGSLIGVGVGICGVSAIIGATGAINAKEEDASYAIATILIFGAIMLAVYPLIGHLTNMSSEMFGFWTGLSIDNTAEAIATGMAFSEQAAEVATVVKLSRNALMGFVILLFALLHANRGLTKQIDNRWAFLWARFPKFVLGFLLLSALKTAGLFNPMQTKILVNMSNWAFLLTFAGVGISLQRSRMKAGMKPFIVGLGVETVVSIVTFIMVNAVLG
ncbi:MAG: putative sulfate exporter family transporter [Firmicutes bacterium]|nr:putative sulfate exporter family transporter [Bacillota bacterium]